MLTRTFLLLIFTTTVLPTQALDMKHPWPDIRQQRIKTLLPQAMQEAQIPAWLIICRENNNDPLAKHIGCENAGKTAAFLFYQKHGKFHSLAFSPEGEATALADIKVLDKVISVTRNNSAIKMVSDFIKKQQFSSIAINISKENPQADGLSFTQYQALKHALGEDYSKRLVSSEPLIYEWLAIKLPEEVEIMRSAAKLTAQWQLQAYAQVVPGVTTDRDIALFLKNKMAQAGVGDAWSADQNPNVVSGTDRGHSHATSRIIQVGDVIQTDFGIRVHDTWVTDIQRFAYVLKPGETTPPDDIAYYWASAKKGREAAFKAMKPGATGRDVDSAQREILSATKSLAVKWNTGHPVGYVAHDSGPSLGGAQLNPPRPNTMRILKPGMTFAFDGFHSWTLASGEPKTISVEEMVVITPTGAQYLIPPQQDLVLISSNQ